MSGPVKRYWIGNAGLEESECGAWVHYDDWLKLEEARFALEFRMELATKRNEQLRALLDEAQRDAARYKWLRDVWWLGDYFDTPDPVTHANSAEEFDAAIDEVRIHRSAQALKILNDPDDEPTAGDGI